MTATPFTGFPQPTSNYFHMPNQWTDITAEMDNLAEMKVVEYVLRHTWGFQEYGVYKAITIDEFVNGRKRQDGSRMDKGTGLSEQGVRDGLKRAIAHFYLVSITDDTDKGRIRKSYMPKMLIIDELGVQNVDPRGTEPRPLNAVPQTPETLTPEVQSIDLRLPRSRPRTEKDTKERNNRKTPEKEDTHTPATEPQPTIDASASHASVSSSQQHVLPARTEDEQYERDVLSVMMGLPLEEVAPVTQVEDIMAMLDAPDSVALPADEDIRTVLSTLAGKQVTFVDATPDHVTGDGKMVMGDPKKPKPEAKPKALTPSQEMAARVEKMIDFLDGLRVRFTGDENQTFRRTPKARTDVKDLLTRLKPTEKKVELIFTEIWNEPPDPRSGWHWQKKLTISSFCSEYDKRSMSLSARERKDAPTAKSTQDVAAILGFQGVLDDVPELEYAGPSRNRGRRG